MNKHFCKDIMITYMGKEVLKVTIENFSVKMDLVNIL